MDGLRELRGTFDIVDVYMLLVLMICQAKLGGWAPYQTRTWVLVYVTS